MRNAPLEVQNNKKIINHNCVNELIIKLLEEKYTIRSSNLP